MAINIDDFMYQLPFESLHLGGTRISEEIALKCRISEGCEILDVGCGKGDTLLFLAEAYGCNGAGIDKSEKMVKKAGEEAERRDLEQKVKFKQADIQKTELRETYDIAILEAASGFLDAERTYPKIISYLKQKGRIATNDLIWKKEPSEKLQKTLLKTMGYQAKTLKQWESFYNSLGLEVEQTSDFSQRVNYPETHFSSISSKISLGLKIAGKCAVKPGMLSKMKELWILFNENKEVLGAGYIIGRKTN